MSVKNWRLMGLIVILATIMAVTIIGIQGTYAKSEVGKVPMDTEKEIVVELHDDYFNPEEITIPSGETTKVILKNVGQKDHTFTVEKLGIDAEIDPGKEKTITVNPENPGTYDLICRYHQNEGMVGKVIVK